MRRLVLFICSLVGVTLFATPIIKYDATLYCVIDLSKGSSASSYPVTYYDAPPSEGFNTIEYKTTKLVLKRVDAGTFTMGDSSEWNNQPHTVTLTKQFYMGLFEVTQKQWELVMGENPSCFSGGVHPVECVSYDDIRGSSEGARWPKSNSVDSGSFLGKLRARTGIDFDLPTEAQWEYTCRAGTDTSYSYGDRANGDYMWYGDNSSGSTHEVGTKEPNPWGFYDMHGNVWEWCLDWHTSSYLSSGENPVGSGYGSYRVWRGGGWWHEEPICTSSCRGDYSFSSYECYFIGLRLAQTIPQIKEEGQPGSPLEIEVDATEVKKLITISGTGEVWTASTSAEWLTLNKASGTATGEKIVCTIAENSSAEKRVGYVYIAGQVVKVTQVGKEAGKEGSTGGVAGKLIPLIREALQIEVEGELTYTCFAKGAELVITVRVDAVTASWKIGISEDAKDDWIFLIDGEEERVGSGIFTLYVDACSDAALLPREATVTIGNQVLTIRQEAGALDPVPEVTSAADLSAALEGSKDGRLATYLTTLEKYKAYRAWVKKVAGEDVTARQAVKDSVLTWFAYALDLNALPETAPTNVVISAIESAAEGGWDLDVSIGDLKVGSDATAADLGTVFSVEGAADLAEESFSADNVTTTFSAAGDGKLKVGVAPKSAAGQFFIRVKMTP